MDTSIFFEKYEDDIGLRKAIDKMCQLCPVNKTCFATGVSLNENGVWGGVYLNNGKIDREYNSHKTKADWFVTWESLTMEHDVQSET
jgi:hypothetical protein